MLKLNNTSNTEIKAVSMQATLEKGATHSYGFGYYGRRKPEDRVYLAMVENVGAWLIDLMEIKDDTRSRQERGGKKVAYRPCSVAKWALVKEHAEQVIDLCSYAELEELKELLISDGLNGANLGDAFEFAVSVHFGVLQNDKRNCHGDVSGDLIINGKPWQIKGERGVICTTDTLIRWGYAEW